MQTISLWRNKGRSSEDLETGTILPSNQDSYRRATAQIPILTPSTQDWTSKGVQSQGQEKLEGASPWGPQDQARLGSWTGRDKKRDRGHLEEGEALHGNVPWVTLEA